MKPQHHTLIHHPTLPPHAGLESLLDRGIVWQANSSEPQQIPPQRARPIQRRGTTTVIPFGIDAIDHELPAGGLPCGSLHEFSWEDPTHASTTTSPRTTIAPNLIPLHLAEQTLRTHATPSNTAWESSTPQSLPFFIVWIGRSCWPSPLVLSHNLRKVSLFIHPTSEETITWAIETTLHSPLVRLVIATCPKVSLTTTRRFALAARKHGNTAILLRDVETTRPSSAALTQWKIAPQRSASAESSSQEWHQIPLPQWQLTLLRMKGSGLANRSWVIGLQDHYDTGEEVSLRLFSRMGDRRYEEEAAGEATNDSGTPPQTATFAQGAPPESAQRLKKFGS